MPQEGRTQEPQISTFIDERDRQRREEEQPSPEQEAAAVAATAREPFPTISIALSRKQQARLESLASEGVTGVTIYSKDFEFVTIHRATPERK